MSSPSSPKIHRPKPRRPYQTSSTPTPLSPSPQSGALFPQDDTPSRTHSILNLTSSTLLGIYSNSSDLEYPSESLSPSSTSTFPTRRGASAPPPPQQKKASSLEIGLQLGIRGVLLFGMGMGYGLLVRHLHDERQLAPFQVEGIIRPRKDVGYLLFWGVAGVVLGGMLPWVDTLFASPDPELEVEGKSGGKEGEEREGVFGADWTPVVRSVGAFVGIAYAIRKLPWTSTLQASLTLALVNPVLWYLIDRSKPGFILSTLVGATGTFLLLISNPNIMPSPAASSGNSTSKYIRGKVGPSEGWGSEWVRRESLEGAVWILSVLFCSCVCFGNIGRRLALSGVRKGVGAERRAEKGR